MNNFFKINQNLIGKHLLLSLLLILPYNTFASSKFITAVRDGDYKAVKELIEKKADINAKNFFIETTALHEASREGHLNIVKLLVEKGADVNVKNLRQLSPLHHASYKGHLDIVKVPPRIWR